MSRVAFVLACALGNVAVMVGALHGAASEAAPSLDDVYRAALARLNAIKSIRVEYEYRFTVLRHMPGRTDGWDQEPWQVLFASNGENRLLRRFPAKNSPYEPTTLVFDGQFTADVRYKYRESPEPVMRSVFLMEGKYDRCDDQELYCSEVLGLLLTDRDRATVNQSAKFPYCLANDRARSLLHGFRVLPQQEEVDGSQCRVVEARGYQRFWVDPKLGCAWRKRERYAGGIEARQVVETAIAGDFVEVQQGVWLPRRYVRRSFAAVNDQGNNLVPYVELGISVKRVAVNSVTDDDFKIAVPAGVDICDLRSGTMRFLPQPVEDTVAGLADTASQYLPHASNRTAVKIVIATLTGIGVVLATVLAVWRWKRRAAFGQPMGAKPLEAGKS
ncbi:MAG: hypothetical protein NUV77_07800 [Thermoguttaceae bacterium]|nr:hypothetical protein [Thermoguttaceae bacterium]